MITLHPRASRPRPIPHADAGARARARLVTRVLVLACAAFALPGRGIAQMCPPPSVALVLHDARGRVAAMQAFDSVTFVSGNPERDQPRVHAGRIPPPGSTGDGRDSVPAVLWQAHTCTAELVSATVWSRGRAMQLHLQLILQTVGDNRPRTPYRIQLDVPRFRPGHWFVIPCGLPMPRSNWVTVPQWFWRRHPVASPQPSRACAPNLQVMTLPNLKSVEP